MGVLLAISPAECARGLRKPEMQCRVEQMAVAIWGRVVVVLMAIAASPVVGLAQDIAAAAPPPSVVGASDLPRDLSPWGMFVTADTLVKAVLIGLAFASVVTWTVWFAKSIELLAAKRRARQAGAKLASARHLAEAAQQITRASGPVGQLVEAAVT